MIIIIYSFYDYQRILDNMKTNNIRFQDAKCSFNSIAEFLRVDYNKGEGKQYLCRAISNFVHSKVESNENGDLRLTLEAIQVRINKLKERGLIGKFVERI